MLNSQNRPKLIKQPQNGLKKQKIDDWSAIIFTDAQSYWNQGFQDTSHSKNLPK
jgi:hypothetical protein